MTDARLEVVIDGTRARAGARDVSVAMAGMEGAAGRVHGAFDRMQRQIFSLRGALTGLAGAFAFRELTQAIDAWNQYEARLRLVTSSAEELASVQERLFESAQATRSAFGATITLYSRVANSTRELGLSQERLIGFTTTVTQAIQIGGASAQEAEAGVRQFAQALASGELRGDEFRSISENLIGLRDALVDGLNEIGEFGDVTVGTLREMAANGELTTDVLIRALEAVQGQTEATFGTLPRTIGQAVQQLENDLFRVIGTTDETTDAGRRFAEAIDRVREVVSSPEFASGVATLVEGLATMAENLDAVVVAGSAFVGLRLGAAFGPLGAAIGVVAGALAGMELATLDVNTAAEDGRLAADSYAEGMSRLQEQAAGAAQSLFEVSQAASIAQIATLEATLGSQVSEFDALGDMIQRGRRQQTPGVFDRSIIGRDQIIQYDRLAGRIEVTSGQLNQARGQLNDTREAIDLATEQMATLGAAASDAGGGVGGLTDETHDAVGAFIRAGDEAARMQFEIGELIQRHAEIRAQLLSAREDARDEGDTLGAAGFTAQLEAAQDSLHAQIAAIEERYIPAAAGAAATTDLWSEAIGRVKGKGDEAEETIKKIAEEMDEISDLGQRVGDSFASAFESAVLRGEEFGDVLQSLALDLARLVLQQQVLAPLSSGIGGLFDGLFNPIGSTIKPTISHAGGLAGAAPDYTRLPRFHSGGLSGDEVLAVLRRNEEVLTLGDRRHRANGGGGATVVNINDYRTRGPENEGVEVKESRIGQDRVIDVTIRDKVKGGLRSGAFDAEMRGRYGVVPATPGR